MSLYLYIYTLKIILSPITEEFTIPSSILRNLFAFVVRLFLEV